jgi:hypothetical protein
MRSFAVLFFALACSAALGTDDVPSELKVLSGLGAIGVRTDPIIRDGKAWDPVCEPSRQFHSDAIVDGAPLRDRKDVLSRQITRYATSLVRFCQPITVSSDPATTASLRPVLYFRVSVTRVPGLPKPLAFCTVECGIDEPVHPIRDKDLMVRAITWSRTRSACVPEEEATEAIKSAVHELLGVFTKDFCKATPTFIVNEGEGNAWRVRR